MEESEGFLRPVDSYRDVAMSRDLESVRTLEAAKTRLFPPSEAPFVTYNRVSWRLDVRKEVSSSGSASRGRETACCSGGIGLVVSQFS